jgi:hypothetical protein
VKGGVTMPVNGRGVSYNEFGPYERNDYTDIYSRIAEMVNSGLLPIPLSGGDEDAVANGDYPNPIDYFIFSLLGIPFYTTSPDKSWDEIQALIQSKMVDIDWVFSPHAFALIKAKMIKQGMKL